VVSNNNACGLRSGILGGTSNTVQAAHTCSFIIGSNLTSNAACTTFVNNLSSQGSIFAGNGFTGDIAGCASITVTNGIITAAS
jgi:hypothetical protein